MYNITLTIILKVYFDSMINMSGYDLCKYKLII